MLLLADNDTSNKTVIAVKNIGRPMYQSISLKDQAGKSLNLNYNCNPILTFRSAVTIMLG